MKNREKLEETTGIQSEKTDLELAEDIAKKWCKKGCVYKFCPAYEGFPDSDFAGCCNVDDPTIENCTQAIHTWLQTEYKQREKGWYGN